MEKFISVVVRILLLFGCFAVLATLYGSGHVMVQSSDSIAIVYFPAGNLTQSAPNPIIPTMNDLSSKSQQTPKPHVVLPSHTPTESAAPAKSDLTPNTNKEHLKPSPVASIYTKGWAKNERYNAPLVPWNITEGPIGVEYSQYTLKDFGTLPRNQYDYDDIVYPIPFNRLYGDYRTHYVDFDKPSSFFPSFVGVGDIDVDSIGPSNLLVITGSSENHIYPNVNMMYSVIYTNCDLSMVFVDFGLEKNGLEYLRKHMIRMHEIHRRLNSTARLYYRKFNYANFPAWFNISDPQIRGGYAWKVVSYFDILNQTKSQIMWSDAGNLWSHTIMKDLLHLQYDGIYTPSSGDALQRWVHYKSAGFLKSNNMVNKIFWGKAVCMGGYLLVNYRNPKVMNEVIFPLLQCAYTQKCVTPRGTSRKNHRQDQSILSTLVQSIRPKYACNNAYSYSLSIHQDCHEVQRCLTVKAKILDNISNRYHIAFSSDFVNGALLLC